ncbi:MAG: phosphoribosylformylglycinamidine synthase subunit PurQ [Candidatus Omnitrophica bacterium]|nr:phosphoribosylformylglycinamidine synthase subunit PurQ [Candidatus Omnitrophota bacterium]
MKFGVVVFPGSNCDEDCFYVLQSVLKQPTVYLWHQERDLKKVDCVVLPGGFSYGDYLRTGAVARFSPIMQSIIDFAGKGGLVIGICNGFQILLEAGLLPGAMIRNTSLRFLCRYVTLRVDNAGTAFTNRCHPGQVIRLPIAHNEGNYFADGETLDRLRRHKQIVLRYCEPDGQVTADANPNGSMDNIAGLVNETGNVFGLMPHPERSAEMLLGSADGRLIFESIVSAYASK